VLARWLTRNDADAADAVQESFLRAFRYFDSYRGGDAKSWVLKIVRRTCYSWLERNRPADVVSLEAEEERGDAVGTPAIDAEALPHLDAAYSLARWLTRNDADAADVVQEAYLRAYRYFDSYREGDAKSWLLRIVRRTCYSWLERNRPAELVTLETADGLDEANAAPPGGAGDTEALLLSRSDLRRLDRLLEALPPPLREAIVLRELHELGYREIAEVTGVPIGTVMSRLHRARSLLRRAYCQTGDPAAASAALPGQEFSPGHGPQVPRSSSGGHRCAA
jgi:RNA polymerase sigma-70 factor (ECF subfamily)